MEYRFSEIEQRWQEYWETHRTFRTEDDFSKPKFYTLDMFPYPSGSGLHVGHPLGYIASDIYARYKRHKGFNVLHPQGYDSFGLPAEQYAIQTGQHPAITTDENIKTYRRQLDQIGFSFDWSREVRTSDPKYYKWTQWIFIQLFNSWYNNKTDSAEGITSELESFGLTPDTLISDDWTRSDIVGNGFVQEPLDLVSVNAHFFHFAGIPASPFPPTSGEDFFYNSDVVDVTDQIAYSMGCHGGVNIPDWLVDPYYAVLEFNDGFRMPVITDANGSAFSFLIEEGLMAFDFAILDDDDNGNRKVKYFTFEVERV